MILSFHSGELLRQGSHHLLIHPDTGTQLGNLARPGLLDLMAAQLVGLTLVPDVMRIEPVATASLDELIPSGATSADLSRRIEPMTPRVPDMDAEFVGFGEVVIDGTLYGHDVIIEKGAVRKRRKGPSRPFRDRYGHTPLSAAEDIPWSADRVVIGTGADGRLPVMDEVRDQAKTRGVELIELPTPEAVRLLQTSKRKQVNAIIHVTC